ncbi:MAG: tRNA methyltransferase [Candidatus Altiarchaeales archaeon HGW-Altiarchaeales-1]|nr:MAG: tRNA methyltransferase [Candidatus Altiarchaeales archaeon HGW-Altiarchaeales-1]
MKMFTDMKILIDPKGRKYIFKGEDMHTKDGMIKADEINNCDVGGTVKTHMGTEYAVIHPNITDIMQKARRGPQAITLKDASLIVGYANLHFGSKVLNSGTGSGILDIFLAHIVYPEKVISYEIRDDFAKIAGKNFERFGIDNVEIKMKNIYEGIDEENLDAVILDLPEPWLVIPHAVKKLKIGGILISFSPSIEQSKKFHDALNINFLQETYECVLRDWDMKVVRPCSRMIAHTGFITVARLISRNKEVKKSEEEQKDVKESEEEKEDVKESEEEKKDVKSENRDEQTDIKSENNEAQTDVEKENDEAQTDIESENKEV